MPNCNEWMELDTRQRIVLIGSICHLIQSDPDTFIAVSSMVREAINQGKLEDVRILPSASDT